MSVNEKVLHLQIRMRITFRNVKQNVLLVSIIITMQIIDCVANIKLIRKEILL